MSDEQGPADPVEALRLEVEKARLGIEQASFLNEQMRTYLERWRTDVQPVHEHRMMSREHGHAFAKVGIQMMFLLNGGALIAFPAFAKLVDVSFSEQITWALLSIASFVLGLVLIAVTALLAYLSMAADAEAVSNQEEYLKLGLNQSTAPNDEKPSFDSPRATAETARARKYAATTRFAEWGLGLTIGSVVAFVFGAFCAGWVLAVSPITPSRSSATSASPAITAPANPAKTKN